MKTLALAMVAASVLAVPGVAQAVKAVNQSFFGVAIEGYDAVAYHSESRPVKGDDRFEHSWMGAKWRFSSAANRDAFATEPERYAPAYGGYCAYAVSQGGTAGIDPKAWRIVDGRLYLNLSLSVQRIWEQDIPGYITKANANWPGLRDG